MTERNLPGNFKTVYANVHYVSDDTLLNDSPLPGGRVLSPSACILTLLKHNYALQS